MTVWRYIHPKYLVFVLMLAALAYAGDFRWKWVYLPSNLDIPEQVVGAKSIIKLAADVGYNGIVLADDKMERQAYASSASYRAAVNDIRSYSRHLGIEIIPRIFSLGHGGTLLGEDVSLAAVLSVQHVQLRVSGGRATLADQRNLLADCRIDMEQNEIVGWYADREKVSIDPGVSFSEGASYRFSNFDRGNARLIKKLELKPYTQYRISARIKTQGISNPGAIRITAIPDGRPGLHLTPRAFDIAATQDWKRHSIVFNSYQYSDIYIYIGAWGLEAGTFWVDDIEMTEALGVNLVRRDSCPVKLTDETGDIEYREGIDYERWEFSRLGHFEWPGTYHPDHPDIPLLLSSQSQIKEGQRLVLSYYAAPMIGPKQVGVCLSQPKVYRILEERIRRVNALFRPNKVFVSSDEIRVLGHCQRCTESNRTSGQILADAIRRCKSIIRNEMPHVDIFVWSDMFDPHHNAIENFYFSRTTFAGSWEGLDPEFRVVNWNYPKAQGGESIMFFNQRGHRQIVAGYYDRPDWHRVLDRWLNAAERHLEGPKVEGVMYCTWRRDFTNMDAFLTRAIQAKTMKD